MKNFVLDKIYNIDCRDGLKLLPDNSIDCIVTSPPYYGLRDYNTPGQIGLEQTPDHYINSMVSVFNECLRVLKKTGTLWLNIGDSYATGGRGYSWGLQSYKQDMGWKSAPEGFKRKDLLGIPWRIAFALQSNGWYLRQDIIWNKPNPMPESVNDRCTKAHEYIFLMSKSTKYFFDAKAIATPYKEKTLTTHGIPFKQAHGDNSGMIFSENLSRDLKVRKPKQWKTPDGWETGSGSHGTFHKDGREKGIKGYAHRGTGDKKINGHSGNYDLSGNLIGDGLANKKSVWTVATQPFKDAHFATFPEKLIIDCIKAGSSFAGIILDPFMGSGTTALVASKLGRHFIGFELSKKYIEIAEKRLKEGLGMFYIENEVINE